jgi:DNA invertase Pin-like site-specific DNA recombinase
MAHLGYARVSTAHQTLDQQLDALSAAGVERVFEDKMTGTREDRPGLRSLLASGSHHGHPRPESHVKATRFVQCGRWPAVD